MFRFLQSRLFTAMTVPFVRNRFALPSCLLSGLVHAMLLLALVFFTIDLKPRLRPAGQAPWSFYLSLASAESNSADDDDGAAEPGSEAGPRLEPPAEAAGNGPTDPGDLLAIGPPSDPVSELPAKVGGAGWGGGGFGRGETGLGELTRGASGTRTPARGRARTSIFGTSGEGYKFVYVFDRSGSMGGSAHTALDAAKRELLKSLDDLSDIHRFEIIFYNENPVVMQFAGPDRMLFANRQNKRLAQDFIAGIRADGATDHELALLLALRLRPDVVFFLTDADEPILNRRQLAKIRDLNGDVTAINCIEFGLGPPLDDDNFLKQLARENRGQHAYFDISKLKRGDD